MDSISQQILELAEIFGCSVHRMKRLVRRYGGRIDLDSISLSLRGVLYQEPKEGLREGRFCLRCKLKGCICSQSVSVSRKVVWESRKGF